MRSATKKIEEIKQYGYELDFGQALEQAFVNYKKIALITGVVILVLIIVFYAILFGIAGVFFGIGTLTDYFTDIQSNTTATTSVGLFTNLIFGVVGAALIAPLNAGILQMAHNAESYKEFSFATAFRHYKGKYIKDLFLSAFIISLTSNIISFAMEILFPIVTSDGIVNQSNLWVKIVVVLFTLFTAFFTFLTIPLIIFGDLNAVESIKGSIVLVSKRPFVILLLLLVCSIGALVGVIGCCIGICFTLPLVYSMQYTLYRTAVGIDEEDELDEIGLNSDFQ